MSTVFTRKFRLRPHVGASILLGIAIGFGSVGNAVAKPCPDGTVPSHATKKGSSKDLGCTSVTKQISAQGLVKLRDGRELLRDGEKWYPKGMTFFGRLIPAGFKSDSRTMYAQRNFGQKYMDALKWMGGDTVRLQIGMPFLDPESPQFNPSYIEEIASAVDLSRRNGMSVILSMQWQERKNVQVAEKKMPGGSALRAWEVVAPRFASDSGVMYELFNEPTTTPKPTREEWSIWQNGHQAIVDMIRNKGIHNVLIVEGPTMGKTLSTKYPIRDPLKQTAYGIHPRLRAYLNSPKEWDERFGNFAESHAVIATEWGHGGITCRTANGELAGQFLKYLEEKNIGLIGWGMENKNSKLPQMLGNGQYKTSTFRGVDCRDRDAGPGEDMRALFQRKKNTSSEAAHAQ